jgi:hypothetical protein
MGPCSLDMLRSVAAVLEVRLDITGRWRGADGERLMSERHARMATGATSHLITVDWAVRPEVSFSIYGERGVIDLLAWHEESRTLLVVELKTAIVDVGELLGTFDRKRRLAATIARDLGWDAGMVAACLWLSDTRTNHRRLAEHEAILRAALPADGRTLQAWLRRPTGPIAALAFLPISPVPVTGQGARLSGKASQADSWPRARVASTAVARHRGSTVG